MYDFLVFQSVFRLFHDFLLFHLLFSSLLFSSLLFSSLLFSLFSYLSLSSFSVFFSSLFSSLLLSCLSSYMSLFLFLFFFFSFLFSPSSSLSSSLSLSFTAHTETRSTRQVTPPTKNGHAPSDPLNQERAINLSILAMSHPGKFSRVESN